MAGTVVASTINNDTGLFATNNAYLGIAKAWAQYNGSTQTIASSFNVSSITRSGTGSYVVNFTTAFASANYVVVSNGGQNNNLVIPSQNGGTYSTTQVSISSTVISTQAAYDSPNINIAVFSS
jgi:hypothetical protein